MRTDEAVQAFITAKRAARRSPHTIKWYEWTLGDFAERFPSDLPLAPEPLEMFLASIKGEPETVDAYYRSLRALYRWLHRKRRRITENPVEMIDAPTVPNKIPRFLSEQELVHLLTHPDHTPTEKALLMLLADTGIRIGEAATVSRSTLYDDTLLVTGKAGPRIVPALPHTIALLHMLPISVKDPDAVFVGNKGRYTVDALRHKVTKCFHRVGLIGKRSSAHTMRHTFATLWEGDELILQQLLGHRTLEMVKRYRQYRVKRAITQHRLYSPLLASLAPPQLRLPL